MTMRERFTRATPAEPTPPQRIHRPPLRVGDVVVAWVGADGERHEIESERPVSVWEVGNGYVKAVEAFPRTVYSFDGGGLTVPPEPQRLVFAVDDSQDDRHHAWRIIHAAGLVRTNDIERRAIGDQADEPLWLEAWDVVENDRHAMHVIPAEAPTW